MIQIFHSVKPFVLCVAILIGLSLQGVDAKGDRTITGKYCPQAMETVLG